MRLLTDGDEPHVNEVLGGQDFFVSPFSAVAGKIRARYYHSEFSTASLENVADTTQGK